MNHISSTISFILQGYGKTLLHRKCSELKKNICLQKFYKLLVVHRKTSVLESFFNKVAGIKRVRRKHFPKKCFF